MPRGRAAKDGDERQAKNGYWYTKVENRGWVLTHWLTAEKKIGRMIDPAQDVVKFVNSAFKRDPHNEAGVYVIPKKTSSKRKRKAILEDRIRELSVELSSINRDLDES